MNPSRTRRGAKVAALLLLALVLAIGAAPGLAKKGGKHKGNKGVTVVTPKNLHGWGYFDDQADQPLTPEFVKGPDTPPLGKGSARLAIESASEGEILSANIFLGTPLADITSLSYQTFVTSHDTPGVAPSLQLGIDFDSTDDVTGFQGRLVFVPDEFGTRVELDQWQTWNPLDDSQSGGNGTWFFTRDPGKGVCPQSNKCTWTEVLAAFPHIAINPVGAAGTGAGFGLIGFKVGSGEGAVDANVDDLSIQFQGQNKPNVFNFESKSKSKKK